MAVSIQSVDSVATIRTVKMQRAVEAKAHHTLPVGGVAFVGVAIFNVGLRLLP